MIKIFAKSIGKYKKETLLTPLLVTLEVILDVIIPVLMAMIIDRGINGKNPREILVIGAGLLFCAFLALWFGVLSGRLAAIASAGFAKNLRQQMFSKIQTYSFANIDHFSTSSLITRLTTDVSNVQNAFQMTIRILVRSPLLFIFSLYMAFRINSELALVLLFSIPVLAIGLAVITRFAFPTFQKVFKIYDKLNRVVQENLQGVRVVKSYVREDHEITKFKNVSQQIYKAFTKAERIVAFNSPLMQFSIFSTMLLVSWIGAQLIVSNSMTTGELMSMFMYVMQILNALNMMSMVFVMMIISKASGDRIVEVLTEDSSLTNIAEPVMTVPDGSIEFNNVDFGYSNNEDKLVLSQTSFKINSGETVGIIGSTGSGKSSLVQLIPRLYDATNGSVKVGGIDVRNYDLATLRDNVAMVLQNNVLFSGTINDNLRWGNQEASDAELLHASQLAQADEFIQRFPEKYDTYIEAGGTNVSGGQKQRLTIARALLKQPKILILDDSTSAVDTKTDSLIQGAFRAEIPHTTQVIISQRISSIAHADKIIVMNNGVIDGIGTHDELLASNQIYQEVTQSQQKGFGEVDE